MPPLPDHFEVTPDQLQKVILTAMEKGADYACLYFRTPLLIIYSALEDGKVNSAYSNIGFGVGIRVLKGDQTGYAYCRKCYTRSNDEGC